MNGAISQVEIDEVLIRHPDLARQSLEISHRPLVEPDGNRLLKAGCVGVPLALHLREVIVSSHIVISNNCVPRSYRPFGRKLSGLRTPTLEGNDKRPGL